MVTFCTYVDKIHQKNMYAEYLLSLFEASSPLQTIYALLPSVHNYTTSSAFPYDRNAQYSNAIHLRVILMKLARFLQYAAF